MKRFIFYHKRKLPSGRLYFIFNEGTDKEKETIKDTADKLYRLNAVSGEITKLDNNDVEVVCGDIAVIYETDCEIDTVSDEVEYAVNLNEFKTVKMKEFTIT